MLSPAVSNARLAELLLPYDPEVTETLVEKLSIYLALLLRWNGRVSLTAMQDPEEIVRRHFGESLFVARHLPACKTLLDFGSGAGFPGLPIQLARPLLTVTLGEAQNRKASFLREAVRVLGLSTEVWDRRVEAMPEQRCFDVVTMRGVDKPEKALRAARRKLAPTGVLALLTTDAGMLHESGSVYRLPNSERTVLQMLSHVR